jgi:hypothetical protein
LLNISSSSSSSSSSSVAKQPFFRAIVFLRKFCKIASGLHFSGSHNNFFTQGPTPNPQPGGAGPYDGVAKSYPRHWVPFPSPSTTRGAAVKVFESASTWEKYAIRIFTLRFGDSDYYVYCFVGCDIVRYHRSLPKFRRNVLLLPLGYARNQGINQQEAGNFPLKPGWIPTGLHGITSHNLHCENLK